MKILVTLALIFFFATSIINTSIKAASIRQPQFAILVEEQPLALIDTNSTSPEGRFFVTHGLALLKGAVIGVKAGVVGGAALAGGASQLSSLATGLTNATSQLSSLTSGFTNATSQLTSTFSNATSQLTSSLSNATSQLTSLASSQLTSLTNKLGSLGNFTALTTSRNGTTSSSESTSTTPICIVTRRRRSVNYNSDYEDEVEYFIEGRQIIPDVSSRPAITTTYTDGTNIGDAEPFPMLGTASDTDTESGTAPDTQSAATATADATGTFEDSGTASGTGTGSQTNSLLGTGTATTTQTVTATGTVAPIVIPQIAAKTTPAPLTCIIITKDASDSVTTAQPNILSSFGLGKRKR